MLKLSKLNETIFGDMIKRSYKNEVRKEDEIKFIDLGLSVLWSEDDLEINGKTEFIYDEIKNFEKGVYRLPTREEADELFSNSISNYNDIKKQIILDVNNNSLGLNVDIFKKAAYWCFSDHKKNDTYANIFTIKKDGAFYPRSAYAISHFDKPHKVRLVKNKSAINETIFGDMLKRSYKDEVRKEDDPNILFINSREDPDNYYIEDGLVCCKGDVLIYDEDIVDGHFPVKFGKVDGFFDCSNCPSLTSLEGAPEKVGDYFGCFVCNSLTSLEGAPKEVGGDFSCHTCKKQFSKSDLPKDTIINGKFKC